MRGEKDGLAAVTGFAHQPKDFLLHKRVEAARGFVEHEQLGLVHERLHDAELLLVALRQLSYRAVQVKPKPFGQLLHVTGGNRPRDVGVVRQ